MRKLCVCELSFLNSVHSLEQEPHPGLEVAHPRAAGHAGVFQEVHVARVSQFSARLPPGPGQSVTAQEEAAPLHPVVVDRSEIKPGVRYSQNGATHNGVVLKNGAPREWSQFGLTRIP